MATLDHIGLNRYIYMSASAGDMTLGSFDMEDIKNADASTIIGSSLDDSRLLLGINLYNNGPYGYSSWQQVRMSENPLSRHLRKNNQYSIIGNSRDRIYFREGKRYVVTDRHGKQNLLDEPAVVSNYKPISLVGSLMEYNNVGMNFSIDLTKKISMNNNITYFTNDKINNIAGLIEDPDEVYDVLKGYYLEDALNSPDSPLSSFEKLVFRQTIYPPQQYTYKSYTRARTIFTFNWNSEIQQRQQTDIPNAFAAVGHHDIPSSSIWPLDVDPNWTNRILPLSRYVGRNSGFGLNNGFYDDINSSFGVLQNHYSQLAEDLSPGVAVVGDHENKKLMPGPLYSRRHTLETSQSVTAPSGKIQLRPSGDLDITTIFGGEAAWDVPQQSGKYPFHDSYAECTDEMRRKAKDYTIVPEFKMSDNVEVFLSSSAFSTPENMFSITGSKQGVFDSSQENFYKIYSNSDFLKNFDIVLEDHKDFTDPSKITLKCKAFKKLVPYNGFYPCQRTVQLAERFSDSYRQFVQVSKGGSGFSAFGAADERHGFQNIITPLFAPGVLFNSIKSGVACDYPIIKGDAAGSELSIETTGDQKYSIQNTSFYKRIPFEAIIEPEKHLSDFHLVNNEPHPSGNLDTTAFWDGQGDEYYSRMANNFIAEVPNFFLKNERFTTLASSPQKDPNFGQIKTSKYSSYGMRIKMYRSMDKANLSVSASAGSGIKYVPPQDIIDSERKETITMYSRPSAFGPPSEGTSGFTTNVDNSIVNASSVITDSTNGFNFPFTPPYYHGQAWADITFTPTAFDKKYTIAEIIASSTVRYYRFDTKCWGSSLPSGNGPQALSKINTNAMQLSSSVNIFSKGTLGEVPQNIQDIASIGGLSLDDESLSRWIIQPKFETPILNFADYVDNEGHTSNVTLPTNNLVASQTPIGMWHQYGRIPERREGIYLQVTDIPKSWSEGNLGVSDPDRVGSLAELCGFSQNPVKLGQVNEKKKISECVVAIPFIENSGVKEFFKIGQKFVNEAISGDDNAEETIVDLVDKMKRFIFPPTFDFVNFPNKVDPIAMYVFEFSSFLSQQDLADIWQNVLPNIGRNHEMSEASISHSLFGARKMINRSKIRDDIRWMVFKVKQRAASRYYDQVYEKKGSKLTDLVSEVTTDTAGPRSKIQYNWPYDFFSLVELVKIDASVEFSDVETDDNGNETVVPKVATEENARIQLDTLFPRAKK